MNRWRRDETSHTGALGTQSTWLRVELSSQGQNLINQKPFWHDLSSRHLLNSALHFWLLHFRLGSCNQKCNNRKCNNLLLSFWVLKNTVHIVTVFFLPLRYNRIQPPNILLGNRYATSSYFLIVFHFRLLLFRLKGRNRKCNKRKYNELFKKNKVETWIHHVYKVIVSNQQ